MPLPHALPRHTHRASRRLSSRIALLAAVAAVAACAPSTPPAARTRPPATEQGRLPTGARLDPAAPSTALGQMPLAMTIAPGGQRLVFLLDGWRQQGVQVVDRATGRLIHTESLPSVFLGLAFSPDGRSLWASGGNGDQLYRFDWAGGDATLADSLPLAPHPAPHRSGVRYPAGLAFSPDGRTVYVAENLADSLAVVDLASRRVVQRVPTERYPYGVVVAHDGTVYVSAWGGHTISIFTPRAGGTLDHGRRLRVGRHPSAMLLSPDDARLYVASGSTDRVIVVDTHENRVLTQLLDPPPAGPAEGSTPDALALSPDGTRLFVAEGDANAVAIFDLSPVTSGVAGAAGDDRLAGRVPVEWYPAALAVAGDTLLVANAKGRGTAPNPDGPTPVRSGIATQLDYTLGQLTGSLITLPGATRLGGTALAAYTARVTHANHWARSDTALAPYPPFTHVIYVIKENRTYDEVLGDLPQGDGDSALVFFPRADSPNHHALAERFGIFDRFFTNAEVSADGHNWSTAAYATDYVQKTVPSEYSDRGRAYDYEGTNRDRLTDDDVAEPANGYLWNLAQRAGITFRNYGEFVVPAGARNDPDLPRAYLGDKPFLASHTSPAYPGFDLRITDQARMDVWIAELHEFERSGRMPQLEIVRLPNDHTAGTRVGMPTPRAYMADNDLALGRMIEALSRSRFWASTVVFVVEDDAQNGPDHVDSHRAPFYVISAWNRPGVHHRFTNTTDVIATIADILHLGSLSQFDYFGRPLRGIYAARPDLTPYAALQPAVSLDEHTGAGAPGAAASARIDLRIEDQVPDGLFNRILWRAIKGPAVPYPGATRMSALEAQRARD